MERTVQPNHIAVLVPGDKLDKKTFLTPLLSRSPLPVEDGWVHFRQFILHLEELAPTGILQPGWVNKLSFLEFIDRFRLPRR